MGAWIETAMKSNCLAALQVAPLVGAWIETSAFGVILNKLSVAPLVGAWIETIVALNDSVQKLSRTPRGCVD